MGSADREYLIKPASKHDEARDPEQAAAGSDDNQRRLALAGENRLSRDRLGPGSGAGGAGSSNEFVTVIVPSTAFAPCGNATDCRRHTT